MYTNWRDYCFIYFAIFKINVVLFPIISGGCLENDLFPWRVQVLFFYYQNVFIMQSCHFLPVLCDLLTG